LLDRFLGDGSPNSTLNFRCGETEMLMSLSPGMLISSFSTGLTEWSGVECYSGGFFFDTRFLDRGKTSLVFPVHCMALSMGMHLGTA
jgi:hypothetical protein